jgi:hypothetical protein
LQPTLGAELATTFYTDSKGRPKQVRYWALDAGDGATGTFDGSQLVLPMTGLSVAAGTAREPVITWSLPVGGWAVTLAV